MYTYLKIRQYLSVPNTSIRQGVGIDLKVESKRSCNYANNQCNATAKPRGDNYAIPDSIIIVNDILIMHFKMNAEQIIITNVTSTGLSTQSVVLINS